MRSPTHRCKSECKKIKYLPSSAGLLTDGTELTPTCPEVPGQCLHSQYFPSPTTLSGETCKHPRSYGTYSNTGYAGEKDPCASQEENLACSTADGGIHDGFGVCHVENLRKRNSWFGFVRKWSCMQCVCGKDSCTEGYRLDFSRVGKPCPGAVCDNTACCIPTTFKRSNNYRSELVLACQSEVRTRPELCLVDCKCTPRLIYMPCTLRARRAPTAAANCIARPSLYALFLLWQLCTTGRLHVPP